MLRAHKIKLAPTKEQVIYFARSCGVARHAYNWALAAWKEQYEAGGKPSEMSLRKQYNALKPVEFPWAIEVTKNAPQQAIKNLGTAVYARSWLARRHSYAQGGGILKMPKCHDCGKFCRPVEWQMIYSCALPEPQEEIYKCASCVEKNGSFVPQSGIKPEHSCGGLTHSAELNGGCKPSDF